MSTHIDFNQRWIDKINSIDLYRMYKHTKIKIEKERYKCKHKALSEKSRHEKRLNKSLFMSCHAQTPFFNKAKVNDRREQWRKIKFSSSCWLICAWKEANLAQTLKIHLSVRNSLPKRNFFFVWCFCKCMNFFSKHSRVQSLFFSFLGYGNSNERRPKT